MDPTLVAPTAVSAIKPSFHSPSSTTYEVYIDKQTESTTKHNGLLGIVRTHKHIILGNMQLPFHFQHISSWLYVQLVHSEGEGDLHKRRDIIRDITQLF